MSNYLLQGGCCPWSIDEESLATANQKGKLVSFWWLIFIQFRICCFFSHKCEDSFLEQHAVPLHQTNHTCTRKVNLELRHIESGQLKMQTLLKSHQPDQPDYSGLESAYDGGRQQFVSNSIFLCFCKKINWLNHCTDSWWILCNFHRINWFRPKQIDLRRNFSW